MLKISLPGTCKAYIYLTLKIKKKKEEEEKEKRKLKNLENYDPIAFFLHDMIVQHLKWGGRRRRGLGGGEVNSFYIFEIYETWKNGLWKIRFRF